MNHRHLRVRSMSRRERRSRSLEPASQWERTAELQGDKPVKRVTKTGRCNLLIMVKVALLMSEPAALVATQE